MGNAPVSPLLQLALYSLQTCTHISGSAICLTSILISQPWPEDRISLILHKQRIWWPLCSFVEYVPDLPSNQWRCWAHVFRFKFTPAWESSSWPEDRTKLWWGKVLPHRGSRLSCCKSLPEYCSEWVFFSFLKCTTSVFWSFFLKDVRQFWENVDFQGSLVFLMTRFWFG